VSTSGLNFRDLYFGLASAEAEAAAQPERFLQTYYDRWNLVGAFDAKQYFLVVGPKGSGKTAVNEFTRLRLIERFGPEKVFALTLNLDEVSPGLSPLSTISQKLVSDQAVGTTDTAWRLFLAVRLFELLMRDQGSSLNSDPQSVKLASQLGAAGLMGTDFPTVLRRVRENKTSVSLKGFVSGESTSQATDEVPVTQLGEAILRLVLEAQTDAHFVLAVDGLDRIISTNRAYWLTLAALLRVSDDLHRRLLSAASDIRLLVMCRSDVFRRIIFADSDKIAGDAAIFVDWGASETNPFQSPLWNYLCSKAQISVADLFKMLPSHVPVGLRNRRDAPQQIPIAEFLLQSTRATPREMTMLMRRLQEQVLDGGPVTPQRARRAVDNFASRDLLTTVTAEATGLLSAELGESLGQILSAFPAARGLLPADVASAVSKVGLDRALTTEFCEFLFLAGLLGNFDPVTGYVQFYHRRDTYLFKREGPWILHRGIVYAFNIPFTRGRSSAEKQ
jgi:hypothetical protein